MDFKEIGIFDDVEMAYVSRQSGGYISKNSYIFDEIELTKLNKFILEKSVLGTPIFKLGGGGNRILILSGIHGNELSSQIANLKLFDSLIDKNLKHTIYFIPFAAPKAVMKNERNYNNMDLNRSAHIKDSLSNLIINAIAELKIGFVGDFHTTAYNSNPGFESIFSTKNPTPESFLIATYVSRDVGCEIISFDSAGSSYKGAVEDVCNLRGIPSITGEVLSSFGRVGEGSVERSLKQMKSFLSYFGI